MQSGENRVLIIEDEQPIRRFLNVALSNEGYHVQDAASGSEGLRRAAEQPPDLVILDLGLPDMDGQDALLALRAWYGGPIIVLSARDQEPQKVLALDHGADDYVTKPFGMAELLARMRAALRHARRTAEPTFACGDLKIDYDSRVVQRSGVEVHLTPLEYKLLVTLTRHAGKVLTHRYLLREVWGPHNAAENHYLRVFVASLRRKLEADPARPRYILTEPGVGYRFAAESPLAPD